MRVLTCTEIRQGYGRGEEEWVEAGAYLDRRRTEGDILLHQLVTAIPDE